MGELVLLVVAAAWAAVLIPPLLRSRMENRPNSSVTDFRRQLNKLQSTVPSRTVGPMRGMARPLAQSPRARQGAAPAARRAAGTRSHGERSQAPTASPARRTLTDANSPQRRTQQPRQARHQIAAREQVRRRRSNVLFMLVVGAAAALFVAAQTKSTAMLYLFAVVFLALCGYVYLLTQARQRESSQWPQDWMQHEQRPAARRAYR